MRPTTSTTPRSPRRPTSHPIIFFVDFAGRAGEIVDGLTGEEAVLWRPSVLWRGVRTEYPL
jgi:hypothetical protein